MSQSWLRLPDLLGALGQFLSRVWGKSYFPPDSSLSKLKRGFDCNLFFAPVSAAQCLTGLSFLLHSSPDRKQAFHGDLPSTAVASRPNNVLRPGDAVRLNSHSVTYQWVSQISARADAQRFSFPCKTCRLPDARVHGALPANPYAQK